MLNRDYFCILCLPESDFDQREKLPFRHTTVNLTATALLLDKRSFTTFQLLTIYVVMHPLNVSSSLDAAWPCTSLETVYHAFLPNDKCTWPVFKPTQVFHQHLRNAVLRLISPVSENYTDLWCYCFNGWNFYCYTWAEKWSRPSLSIGKRNNFLKFSYQQLREDIISLLFYPLCVLEVYMKWV